MFLVDKFENEDLLFADVKIMDDSETNIYIKDNSDLCINYSSYEPWHKKTGLKHFMRKIIKYVVVLILSRMVLLEFLATVKIGMNYVF